MTHPSNLAVTNKASQAALLSFVMIGFKISSYPRTFYFYTRITAFNICIVGTSYWQNIQLSVKHDWFCFSGDRTETQLKHEFMLSKIGILSCFEILLLHIMTIVTSIVIAADHRVTCNITLQWAVFFSHTLIMHRHF